MIDLKHLKNFETRIIENNAQSLNKEFIKTHYKAILQMANPIIVDKKIILNGYTFKLMMHLFNICNHVSYIPSFFIKEIAEMSFYLQNLEIDGFFHELKSAKKTEFLSMYYKIVSVIMKNKHIKPEKKGVFEKIISQKLTENTVKWLIMHFTQPNIHIDSNAKIMLKAITQTKFEFFETFAVNFKKTIYDLITSSHTQEKSYLNKYVFKIIEKCLIKLNSIEKDFMTKLSKISHNIIDLFLKNKNNKLQKLFRRSLRILYILYDRSGNPNYKTITLFKNKFFPLFDFPENSINKKFIEKTLWDFVEVNFSILKKKVDLIDYYSFFYNMIINEDPDKSGQKFLNDYVASLYFDNFLTCLEKLFKYEMSLSKGQTMEIAYVKLLHNLFNMLYSDSINPGKKQISIEIICRIVRNCANNMKISILEEISFSHMSFFMEDSNCVLLENLINSIIHNVKIPGIYEYFTKYMDILLIHALRGNYSVQMFQNIIFSLFEKIEDQQIFYLTLSYCKKFFLQLQEEEIPGKGSIFIDLYKDENKIKQVNGFLKIIAISSNSIPSKISDKNILQEILNIYSTFLMIKIFNFPNIDFSFKMKLNSANKEDQNDFTIYFLIFALNIPVLIFNKNSLLTTPVKIELNYNILNKISEKKKLISDEFEDFGDKTRKWIRDLDTISQLYLLGIYTSFIAKYVLLKIYFADYTEEMQRQKEILKGKIEIEKICRVKSSIVNMMDYFTDNSFLYDEDMNELFCKIFDQYLLRYLDLLKNHHNTQFKQKLLSHDLMIGLNYSCFYHEQVREIAINLIKRYANNFPFLLNEYDIFEYYVTVLGMLVSNSLQPYSFFIKKVTLNTNKEDQLNIANNIIELPSEKYFKEQIYIKLSNIFEKCLQKSYIINNNISYNIANYVNKCTLLVLHSNFLERDELNYSINLLQKIYNNIKKIEISSFLKTTAYLDPKKFEDYLKDNVYKNFDKYISISANDDISNFTDYAKSTILQIRNKYMGIIEGKVNNLRINYMNDTLFENFRKLFINESHIGTVNSDEEIINSYCYYKIMNDISLKLQKIFQENDIKDINQNIFPIMVELTSFIVFADMNDFKTTFNKDIITDEIINLITCIPIFLANTSSIEAGSFCWEWILYFNKKKLSSLLNNIILSVKYLKLYRSNFLKIGKESLMKSEIFDIEDFSYKKKRDLRAQYELTTMKELNNKIKINKNVSSKSLFLTEHFVNMVNEKVLNFKDAEPNDLINSQINLLKFLKECMNEFCKCDIEKLLLIFNVCKLFVDLSIDQSLYNQPLYIYLHFLIFNISIELIDIFQGKMDLFTSKLKKEEILEFKILVYLFGFRYFEFDKKRRMITKVVLLSEIEQTLVNCVEVIVKDRNKKENYDKIKRNNTKVKNKNKLLNKVYTFVYSIEANLRDNPLNNDSFLVYDNIKDLLIYLIESEINNLRYWNSPSTFHNSHKKYTPSSSKLKEEKVKDIFETAFAISNKLSIKLVQRFPWIERKFGSYMNRLGSTIYQNKKLFYHQPHALKYLIEYIMKNGQKDLESLTMIKDLIMWKFPSLNYALKYISFNFNNKLVLHKYSMLLLNNANDSAIIFYMPQLIQSIRTETNHIVEKYILRTCKNSCKVAHQFLWSLEVEEIMGPQAKMRFLPKNFNENVYSIAKILRMKILKNFNPMERKFWFDENSTFSRITEVSSRFLHLDDNQGLSLKMSKEEKTDFVRGELMKLPKKMANHIYLPTNPDTKILEIIPHSAVTLQSAKKVPFIVSFVGVLYDGPDSDYLVTSMNFNDYIQNEILYYEHLFRFGSASANVSIDPNIQATSKLIVNKSTQHSIVNEDKNLYSHNFFGSQISSNLLFLDDDPFLYGDEDEGQNLTIPHIEIKIFNKSSPGILNKENIKFETENSAERLEQNINDLSGCTDDAFEEEFTCGDRTKRKMILHKAMLIDKKQEDDSQSKQSALVEQKNFNISCIFKVGDDLRQDSLALQVIHIFKEIFRENNLKLFVYPYRTISTISSNHKDLGGFIEVVQDCDSRDQIGKTFDTDLYDYFICTFGQENSNEFREARKNFIESLAAYAIISYILQIKDRHNGNILVDKHGHIIHIDFGFIFDISPAGNMKFEKAAFKLTKEMIKIMQGTGTEPYATFVDLTIRAFLACRDYMEKLLDPVVLMFNSGLECFRDDSIKNFIDRFKLELNEDEAALYMRQLITSAEDNWRTNFYDFIQKKQNNIYY